MDSMQAAVIEWYAEFKADTKKRLYEKIMQVFDEKVEEKTSKVDVVQLSSGLCSTFSYQ